ncbi:hypothetical protein SDC9_63442 [bioreactor metagenome]|uniref:Uncharacterized protein n=1 Tax=bioreactor metagenome TaxID=1076179 RepID=A0A644XMR4_9ZZZZ
MEQKKKEPGVRMTKASKMALQNADNIYFTTSVQGVTVYVTTAGKKILVQCGAGGPVVYPTRDHARRAVKRVRPDLDPIE